MNGPRREAIRILTAVEVDAANAAPLIDSRERRVRSVDRPLLRSLVKTVLRHQMRLDHVLERYLSRPGAKLEIPVRCALRLGAAQLLLLDRIPPHAAVFETVAALRTLAPRASSLVNAVLRRVSEKEEKPGRVDGVSGAEKRMAVEFSHPEWLVNRWQNQFGQDETRRILEADNQDSPVDLLLDPALGPVPEIVAALNTDGLAGHLVPGAPLAFTITGGDVFDHPWVKGGCLPVVDAAAQALCEIIPEADVILDLAAAPGGKTRTLLARGKAGRIVAVDKNFTRIIRLAENLERGGARNRTLVVQGNGEALPIRGLFSSILLDAPCSGTGTLRKNPEKRYRLELADIKKFHDVQVRLLLKAASLLDAGGVVTYVTCSLEPEENEDVVERVLREMPNLQTVSSNLERLMPLPHLMRRQNGVVRILPGSGQDGFSVAQLQKR